MNRLRGAFVFIICSPVAAAAIASHLPLVALPFIIFAGMGLGVMIWPGDQR